jgi:hypothetical protein
MLLPLNKIAALLQIDETEALNFAVYFGVPRRHGLYDEREFMLAHIKHLRERIFGVVAVESATTEPPSPAHLGRGSSIGRRDRGRSHRGAGFCRNVNAHPR